MPRAVGRKTRRAADVDLYCIDLAPVLSRFVGPFFRRVCHVGDVCESVTNSFMLTRPGRSSNPTRNLMGNGEFMARRDFRPTGRDSLRRVSKDNGPSQTFTPT